MKNKIIYHLEYAGCFECDCYKSKFNICLCRGDEIDLSNMDKSVVPDNCPHPNFVKGGGSQHE